MPGKTPNYRLVRRLDHPHLLVCAHLAYGIYILYIFRYFELDRNVHVLWLFICTYHSIENLPKHHATVASPGCEHRLVYWMPSHLGEYIWGTFKVQRLEKVGTSLNRSNFRAILTALASFLWPLNVCISSFRFLRSKSWKGNIQQRCFNIEKVATPWANDPCWQWWASCHFGSRRSPSLWTCEHGSSWAPEEIDKCNFISHFFSLPPSTWPDLGSHSLIGCWLSLLPETTMPLCGCQSTHLKRRTVRNDHKGTFKI